MTAIQAGDLTTLRDQTKAHQADWRLYVYNDFNSTVMWRGTIQDASPVRGQQSFTVSGSFEAGFTNADVHRHCRVHIGTIQDYDDITRRVVLSFNGTNTLVLDQSDDWLPAFAQTITIYNQYPLWNKLAYADYDTAANTATFYQDGKPASEGGAGLTYNEIQQLRPHIRVGDDIIRRESTFPFYVQIAPSITIVNPDASTGTTTITVSPPSLATVSVPVPGAYRLTFAAAGKGTAHIQHTDSLGGTTTIHRHIIAEDTATDIEGVVTEFEMSRPPQRLGQGNTSTAITIKAPDRVFGTTNGQIDWGTLRSDSLVMVTQADYYGGTEDSIDSRTASTDISNNIILSGYSTSARETLSKSNREISSVTINVETLPAQFTYALSVIGASAPANFLEARAALMTVAGQLFISLDGYSTLCTVRDVELPWSDTARRAGNNLFADGDIMNGATQLARARLMDLTVEANGSLVVANNLNMQDTSTRNAATTVITLLEEDVLERSGLNVVHRNSAARVTMRGGASNGELGSTSQFTPFLVASTNTPSSNSGVNRPDLPKQMFDDLSDALERVARYAEIVNQRYKAITIDLDYRYNGVFHVTSGEWVNLGLLFDATDKANIRGENDLRNQDALVTGITYGEGVMTLTLEREAPVLGLPGLELPQPDLPTQTTIDGNTPTFNPPFTYVPPIVTPTAGILIIVDKSSGIYATADSGANWSARN